MNRVYFDEAAVPADAMRLRLVGNASFTVQLSRMSQTVSLTHQVVQVMGGTLTMLDGSAPPRQIREDKVTVGRAELSDIVLRDKSVSEVHAEFTATELGVRVRDMGSTNGIQIDGHRVVDAYLTRSTVIHICGHAIRFDPASLQLQVVSADSFGELVAASMAMRKLFGLLNKISRTDLGVLIQGESGTGKERVARGIHMASTRAQRPFQTIDCSSIPANLAESELFGHERGSFTGAVERRESPFVEAAGGTIFLDEIGDLPIETQPKLLRVLEERRIKSVGSNQYRQVDVRIIAATMRNLAQDVNVGRFRPDLYYRLKHFLVEIPPLRTRPEDIPLLIDTFARRLQRSEAAARFSQAALSRLYSFEWPGNVRELKAVVEATLALAEPYGAIELQGSVADTSAAAAAARWGSEEAYWRGLWEQCNGNQSEMARTSELPRSTVQTRLAKYGIGNNGNDGGAPK